MQTKVIQASAQKGESESPYPFQVPSPVLCQPKPWRRLVQGRDRVGMGTILCNNSKQRTAKSPTKFPWWGFSIKFPAATYSPTQLPVQYHRPREA